MLFRKQTKIQIQGILRLEDILTSLTPLFNLLIITFHWIPVSMISFSQDKAEKSGVWRGWV